MTLTNNYAAINDGAFLLRLAHLYQVGEHPTLAKPINVSLANIFASRPITAAQEVTLGANQDMAAFQAKKMVWNTKYTHHDKRQPAFERVAFDPNSADLTV